MTEELKPQDAATIDEYVARLPEDRGELLQSMREKIHGRVPGLEETMQYGMPCFGRPGEEPLYTLGSQKAHMALYLCGTDIAARFSDEMKAAKLPKCGKSCARFTVKKQIPDDLLYAMLDSQNAP